MWENLKQIANLHNLPWCILGDFNKVTYEFEKLRGRPINKARAQTFKNSLDDCGMIDLGFEGSPFTWSNAQDPPNLIQCRMDRTCANSNWIVTFLDYFVVHLPRAYSYHCPLLLKLDNQSSNMINKPLRCQTMWLSHYSFSKLV